MPREREPKFVVQIIHSLSALAIVVHRVLIGPNEPKNQTWGLVRMTNNWRPADIAVAVARCFPISPCLRLFALVYILIFGAACAAH